jgi:hypothetical protein
MSKLKLRLQNIEGAEILSREQLKKVVGWAVATIQEVVATGLHPVQQIAVETQRFRVQEGPHVLL